MDKERIKECEEDYLARAQELDDLEHEFAVEVMRQRAIGNVYAPREAATSEMHPYFNKAKAKVYMAKLRLEQTWYGQGD